MRGFKIVVLLTCAVALAACKRSEPPAPPEEPPAPEQESPAEEPTADPDELTPAEQAEEAAAEHIQSFLDSIPDIIATVNGVPLEADRFREEIARIAARGAQIPPERLERLQKTILQRHIEELLLEQEIERLGVAVTPEEIDAEFDSYKQRFRTEEQFENYLKHGKVTAEQIRERMQAKRALEKLIDKTADMAVSKAEAKDFYEQNERFYMDKEGVRASHILIKVAEDASDEQVAEARKKVREALALLKEGKAFEEVAKQISEGPSAPKGGELGFFGRGQMVKEFEDVAFSMEAGQVSDPVRTRFGFHIIKVIEKREERKRPFEDVREQIEESLRNKKFFQERRNLIRRLNEEAEIDILI